MAFRSRPRLFPNAVSHPIAPKLRPRAVSDPSEVAFTGALTFFLQRGDLGPMRRLVQDRNFLTYQQQAEPNRKPIFFALMRSAVDVVALLLTSGAVLPDNAFQMACVSPASPKFKDLILFLKKQGCCDNPAVNIKILRDLIAKTSNERIVDWLCQTVAMDWEMCFDGSPLVHYLLDESNLKYLRIVCRHYPSAINQTNKDRLTILQRILSMSRDVYVDRRINILHQVLACNPELVVHWEGKKVSPIAYAVFCGHTNFVPILYAHAKQRGSLESSGQHLAYVCRVQGELDSMGSAATGPSQYNFIPEVALAIKTIDEQIAELQRQRAQLEQLQRFPNYVDYLMHLYALVEPLTEHLSAYPEVAAKLLHLAFVNPVSKMCALVCKEMAIIQARSDDHWNALLKELESFQHLAPVYPSDKLLEMAIVSIYQRKHPRSVRTEYTAALAAAVVNEGSSPVYSPLSSIPLTNLSARTSQDDSPRSSDSLDDASTSPPTP